MLFSVLLWSICIMSRVHGKNIPVNFSSQERNDNNIINDLDKKGSTQNKEHTHTDLDSVVKSNFQLSNLLYLASKELRSTIFPATLSESAATTLQAAESSPASPSPASSDLSSLPSQPSSSSSPTTQQSLHTTSLPAVSSSSSLSPQFRQPTEASFLSTSSSPTRLHATSRRREISKTAPAFVFRKKKAGSHKRSISSAMTSMITKAPTAKSTTKSRSGTKEKVDPKCALLEKLKAKLPPGCSRTKKVIDPWS